MKWTKIAEDKSNIPLNEPLLFFIDGVDFIVGKYETSVVGSWDGEDLTIKSHILEYENGGMLIPTHFCKIEKPRKPHPKNIKKVTITEGTIPTKVEVEYENGEVSVFE